ncbi:MAG: hypothetical protein M3Q07_00965, partial [Pseudobdellovibrionaceae bacterium]|nr:hypothetical protein [Pseudobdellovibrionaceae bacterium]
MSTLDGTIASRGYAYGQAFLFREEPLNLKKTFIRAEHFTDECDRLHQALAAVRDQIREIETQAEGILDAETRALFESYQLILDDDELVEAIEAVMHKDGVTASWAVHQVMERHADAISRLQSPYLRERAADI